MNKYRLRKAMKNDFRDGAELSLIAGSESGELASQIANLLQTPLTKVETSQSSIGEYDLCLGDSVRGRDVFIIQGIATRPNDNLMELLILVDACVRSSAIRVTAVIPFLGYGRQDKKEQGRTPISAKLLANMLQISGVNHVLSSQAQGFYNIPSDNLSTFPYFVNYFKKIFPHEELVILSKGVNSKAAKEFSNLMQCSFAVLHFATIVHGAVKEEMEIEAQDISIVGEVQGKVAILASDLEDTCKLLKPMARALLNHGAKMVYSIAAHGVLSGKALENLENSEVEQLVLLDTIRDVTEKARKCKKITILGAAEHELAEAIWRSHKGESFWDISHKPVSSYLDNAM